MKKLQPYFFYLSLLFLVFYLYKHQLVSIPEITNPRYLFLSVVFLFFGFIFSIFPWYKILNNTEHSISFRDALVSIGLTIFGKYIPGKIWSIIGRSEYIANKYGHPRVSLASLSFDAQIITIWVGLLLGIIGFNLELNKWFYIASGLWLILSGFIFSNLLHDFLLRAFDKYLKKKIALPRLGIKKVFKLSPYFLFQWIVWCFGFYFLILGTTHENISWATGFGFALAATIGILVAISPGGLGIREGVLAGYLIISGIDANAASTIAITSRLWFLVGEFFIFFTALLLRKK